MRGPGIKPGQEINSIISSIDFTPTILDMFGVDPNPTKLVDGASWLPLVNGKTDDWSYRTDVFVEYGGPSIVPPSAVSATPEQRRAARAKQAIESWASQFSAGSRIERGDASDYEELMRAAVHLDDEGDAAERISEALHLRLERRTDEATVL